MPSLVPSVDPEGLLEYSVVYTDRALNHMSKQFQGIMQSLSSTLKSVYGAQSVAIVPGGGTFAMEAVARQFAHDRKVLVIRNGWFSFRWSQIFDAGKIPSSTTVMKARPVHGDTEAAFAPAPIEEVVAAIHSERPELVFAPHVETASGMLLPDDYLRQIADAVHAAGGLFVLDCIASGTLWVNMKDTGVDVLLSAPQKGWSASPCCGLVMLSPLARQRIETTQSSSFAADLRKWLQVMETYEQGGHMYHATMPTDGLKTLHQVMQEAEKVGFAKLCEAQTELGQRVRALLAERGFKSVAAPGFEAPGVVVSYTRDEGIKTGRKFADAGLQTAAGVPLQCDEPADFSTFRLGLFGLDKLQDIDRTVRSLEMALNTVT